MTAIICNFAGATNQTILQASRGLFSVEAPAGTFALSNPPVNPVKWNPGHYAGSGGFIRSNSGSTSGGTISTQELQSLCPPGNPTYYSNIIGYRMYITWGAIEQVQGVYDWSSIDNTLAFLAPYNKHLIVTIFGGDFSHVDIPGYITSNASYGVSSTGGQYGYWLACPAIYRAAVLARYEAVWAAMLARYNSNPLFEGGLHQEDSAFVSNLSQASDWDSSGATFYSSCTSLISACVAAAPNTTVAFQGTFQVTDTESFNLCTYMYNNRCLPAETDTYGYSDHNRPFNNFAGYVSATAGWPWGPCAYLGGREPGGSQGPDLRPLTRFWNDIEPYDLGVDYGTSGSNGSDNQTPTAPGYDRADILQSINTIYKGTHATWAINYSNYFSSGNTRATNNVWGTPGSGGLADFLQNPANAINTTAYPQNYPT